MTMKPIGESLPTSLTTTRPSPEPEVKTGIPSSGSGCGTTSLTVIDGGTVEGRDSALLTLIKQLCGFSPEEIRRNSYTADGFDSVLIGYRIAGPLSPAAEMEIRRLVAEANQPAIRREIVPTLNALAKAMPSHDGSDAEAWMELVIMSVDDVSADVILEALKKIVRREKWRPTPAEVREECLWLGRKRRALLKMEIG